MAGVVTGVSISEGLERIDMGELDVYLVRELAAQGEHGLLKGFAEREPDGQK